MLYGKNTCCGGPMMPPSMATPMAAPMATPMATPMMPPRGGCGCGCGYGCGCGCECDPIIEPTIEKCVNREFCHVVKHICPVHTKVINNHVIKHVYDPCFTCSEENVVCNIDQGSCCQFQ